MKTRNTALYAVRDTVAMPVREDSELYLPDLLHDEDYEPDPTRDAAAHAHVKGLRTAERLLDEALNLSEVLRASAEDYGDSRAMQADIVLQTIEKKLKKAHDKIERQDRRHRNLYLAYFDLRDRTDEEAG
jgi:hypothetical protein